VLVEEEDGIAHVASVTPRCPTTRIGATLGRSGSGEVTVELGKVVEVVETRRRTVEVPEELQAPEPEPTEAEAPGADTAPRMR
jgi:hypothetical protein